MSERPIAFRNVVRYVRDPALNVPLYEALGFRLVRTMGGMVILQNDEGLKLLLHEGEPDGRNVSALGFTMLDNDVAAAGRKAEDADGPAGPYSASRAYVEKAGWRLLRAPDAGDQGFFYIYGDLDGNPINLVGERRHA